MSVSPAEFWSLLAKSGLVTGTRLEQLRERISQRPEVSASPTADRIAHVLVANGILTDYQSRQLLMGKQPGTIGGGPSVEDGPLRIQVLPPESTMGKPKSKWPVLLMVALLGLAGLCAATLWLLPGRRDEAVAPKPVAITAVENSESDRTENFQYELTDDTDALWTRPTTGQPISLSRSCAGTQRGGGVARTSASVSKTSSTSPGRQGGGQ